MTLKVTNLCITIFKNRLLFTRNRDIANFYEKSFFMDKLLHNSSGLSQWLFSDWHYIVLLKVGKTSDLYVFILVP